MAKEIRREQQNSEWQKMTYLDQGANKTLKWTLWTILREWRLLQLVTDQNVETFDTHSLRSFNMLDQHDQLLLTDETLETGIVLVIRVSFVDDGKSAVPGDILSLGEQIFHQRLLA
jgi:hypothetical protein